MNLDAREEEVTKLKLLLEAAIENVTHDLHEALDVRKRELKRQISVVTHTKLKTLASERDAKETMQAQLSSSAVKLKESLDKSDVEMLRGKKGLVKKVKSVNSQFKDSPELLEIGTQDDTSFTTPKSFTRSCQDFGQIFTPNSLDSLKFTARGRGLEMAEVGEDSVVILTANDHRGEVYNKPINLLECELLFEETKKSEQCKVTSRGNGLYEINYKLMNRGRHQLHIRVDRRHIKGSPFSVMAKPALEQLQDPILVIDEEEVIRPWGVAVNTENQELIVTEYDQSRVFIFNLKGEKLRSFGERGSGLNQLNHPRGVALDDEKNIFVVDSGNHCVKKFTRNGRLLSSTSGSRESGPKLQLTDPKGLAFNPTNCKVYVTDVTRVQVLNSDLSFSSSFGSKGTGKEQFVSAFGVAFDTLGTVYVSDNSNNNIQIFTSEGQFLRVLQNESAPSPRGFVKGLLGGKVPTSVVGMPTGLAVDDSRRVYVCSEQSHLVAMVTPDGQWVWSVGKEGFTSGEFKRPRGVAVSNSGFVYVCDFENGRVQVF